MINWLKRLMPLTLVDLLKTDYNSEIKDIADKILDIFSVATTVNAKINEYSCQKS